MKLLATVARSQAGAPLKSNGEWMAHVSAVMIALIVFIHLPVVEADWYGA